MDQYHAGEHVYVVGGANSAGQAALHPARFAHRVTLLVRGPSLTAGMSDYLVRQVAAAVGEGSVAVGSVHQYLEAAAARGADAT